MSDPAAASPSEEPSAGPLNAGHISRLNTLLAAEARHAGVSPEHMADLFMEMIASDVRPLRSLVRFHAGQ
ncbi:MULTISPECIES: hypothetical protein [unclassified Streptomyces]|uniref:hypothetical protein n=1 Tax=unclassified Streptomyces TaxID=2593676 RepID=UPI00226EBCEC|nr:MULTISPECIES: hypothetical protein [unclassified Streptomyces]MCY0924586.1 hypothetical protein [Streptomyces sp. H27-G5]MCY0963238.1 hypothetical protein [Streptomyces sp. H27-H5]